MRMRYMIVIPSILFVSMFLGHSARAQKPTPVTDPALQELMAKAEKGDPEAQVALGLKYYGLRNYAEAVEWYRKAADQGNAKGQFKLGTMYEDGQGVYQDYIEAAKLYRKAADQGDASAQYNLGLFYTDSRGVLQDYAEAAKWFRKAAEQGDSSSQFNLGLLYSRGRGVSVDYAEAAKWYRKAAEQGHATAQSSLGNMYSNGTGVPQDYVEAYKWLNLAASQGLTDASTRRNIMASLMTPDQIAEGQRRSSAFVPRKGSPSQGDEPAISTVAPRFSGSGFFISQDGYILTNFHVVENASKIIIQTKQGTFPAQVVKVDAANDIALLKISGSFQPLPVATSRSSKLGEAIFTIGFPNIEVQGVEPKLSKGEIGGLGGVQDDPRSFQVSLPVQPGNSGGPLINMSGNVVGLMTAKLNDLAMLKLTGSLPQNVSYALKGSFMTAFLETVPELAAKLKAPNATMDRKFEDVVKEAQSAVVLILVY
jgi:TPR repeat protein